MPLRQITRSIAAALFAASAAPAFAQSTDLGVTLVLHGDFNTASPPVATPATAGFTIGTEETYTVKVKNNGTLIVTEFTVNATTDAALTGVSVTDCKPTGTGTSPPPFPCKWTGSLSAGATTTLTIAATYPAPDPLNPATATCPGGLVNVTSSVTVSNPMQEGTALTDSDATNDTASYTTKLRDWADLEVSSFDGPGNVNEGQKVTYTAVVTNLGPCSAQNVRLTFTPDSGSLVFADAVSSNCTNGAAGFAPANRCELGTLAKGASQTVTADYSVITFPTQQTEAAVSNGAGVVSRSVKTASGPPEVWAVGADDPDADNDSNSTTAKVDLSGNGGGCSTGGGSSLLAAALALVALRLARRRTT